jgi:hypothetical protein
MTKLGKNVLVDLLSYVAFVLLLGTGLILAYILPHGSGRLAGRGIGGGAGQKLVTSLWGMTREQWGEIHLWIAAGTLVVLTFHLVLHWKWIICVLGKKEKPTGVSGQRAFLGLAGMLGTLALVALPFLTPTEQMTRDQILKQGDENADTPTASETVIDSSRESTETDDIFGAMTLREVQDKIGVPYEHILSNLGVPTDIHPDEKLGRLRKAYGFSIDDMRNIVKAYKQ